MKRFNVLSVRRLPGGLVRALRAAGDTRFDGTVRRLLQVSFRLGDQGREARIEDVGNSFHRHQGGLMFAGFEQRNVSRAQAGLRRHLLLRHAKQAATSPHDAGKR